MGKEGIEPPNDGLEPSSLPLAYIPIISGSLCNSDSSSTNILFSPIKNVSLFGFLRQIKNPRSKSNKHSLELERMFINKV